MSLIECIPNFSEGRRGAVIDKIEAAIASGGAHVLDVSSDVDHNRTVITLAGTPEAIEESAYRGIQTAAEYIDLTKHAGVHPRIGATDVVPFVPLQNASMADCVRIAKRLGQRVGKQLDLPVFLYADAATEQKRENLAEIRRGGYERLQSRINQGLLPDYGSKTVGTAGAVVIGARGPLIAFNAYLDTGDVQVAKRIAVAIRESSGGLPGIKALGFLVDSQAQVSMNITDYTKTSLYEVISAIHAEAQQHGTHVQSTEIIGLVPQQALLDAALQCLQVRQADYAKTIEHRLNTFTHAHNQINFE